MFASLTRIDVPGGNEPMNTSAPSVPTSDCTRIDIVGDDEEAVSALLYPLLSIARTAPSSRARFLRVTITIPAARLLACTIIAATLRLIIMLPCAVTFTNTTLVQDVLIVSLTGGSAESITVQGRFAKELCTSMSARNIAAMAFIFLKAPHFFIPEVGAQKKNQLFENLRSGKGQVPWISFESIPYLCSRRCPKPLIIIVMVHLLHLLF